MLAPPPRAEASRVPPTASRTDGQLPRAPQVIPSCTGQCGGTDNPARTYLAPGGIISACWSACKRPREGEMALLLPEADGIAEHVARQLPEADVITYGATDPVLLAKVTFYCLPYMGDEASVAIISDMPALRVIQSLSSGVDDVLAAVPRQVTLCNGHGLGHEEGTAELAVTLILTSLRRIAWFAGQQSQRTWSHVRTESLDGKRDLLVGYGAIGEAIETRLAP